MPTSPEYAVLGAAGQLGHEFISRLPKETAVWTRRDADLAITGQVSALICRIKPKIVINCAAYNRVDQAEDEPLAAFAANAFGVRELALACREVNAVLVHFSTDYVFGLERNRSKPYLPSDTSGPLSTYGISKLTGEYFVRAFCPHHYVIRTCGLYGLHVIGGKGGNFVETMLKLAQAGKPIRVVNDQVLTPSSASDVAATALQLIKSVPFGLYHLTNSGQCSWYEFACEIFEKAQMKAEVTPIPSSEYKSKAIRPAYSVLASEQSYSPQMRPWQEALAAYLASR